MGKVVAIVYRTLATHITKKVGLNKRTGPTYRAILIQLFSSALTKSPEVILNSPRLATKGYVIQISIFIKHTPMLHFFYLTENKIPLKCRSDQNVSNIIMSVSVS
jgi:hypothetical protein